MISNSFSYTYNQGPVCPCRDETFFSQSQQKT